MKDRFEIWGCNGYIYYVGIMDNECVYIGENRGNENVEYDLVGGANCDYTLWDDKDLADGQTIEGEYEEFKTDCELLAQSWIEDGEIKIEIFELSQDYEQYFEELADCEFLGDMIPVDYYAFAEPDFPCDGHAFIPINAETFDYWDKAELLNEDEEDGELDLPLGWLCVYIDGEARAVRESNVYTEVFRESALSGGWGMNYPTGGMTSCSGPTHFNVVGDEICYYVQHYF